MYIIKRQEALSLVSIILLLLGLYHLLILGGFLPSEYVWSGKIESERDLLIYESISLGLIATALIAIYFDYIEIFKRFTQAIFYLYTILFGLNTIANLFAPTQQEQILFSIITFIMTLCMFRLSMKDKDTSL
ncbi:MAG: hypothetical protein U9N52_05250 [Campylobacterota bacterium]|nr:hypothetical protein [Campylobacterota bacterium]